MKPAAYFLTLLFFLTAPTLCPAALQVEGSFIQSGLLHGHVEPGTQVYLGKRQLRTTSQGDFICGFGRDANPRQKLIVIGPDGARHEQQIVLMQRHYDIQKINGISPQMMNPSKTTLARISEEAQLVAAARKTDSDRSDFQQPFIWPVTGRISGIYGSQRVLNGEPRRPHFGVDIAAATGTTVKAPAGGVVTLAHPGMFYSGKTVIIDHGYGLSSSFLHLSKILVKVGDIVTQGQPIAKVGATGRVTGPHLDWRINWFEQRLDPALFVPPMTGS